MSCTAAPGSVLAPHNSGHDEAFPPTEGALTTPRCRLADGLTRHAGTAVVGAGKGAIDRHFLRARPKGRLCPCVAGGPAPSPSMPHCEMDPPMLTGVAPRRFTSHLPRLVPASRASALR